VSWSGCRFFLDGIQPDLNRNRHKLLDFFRTPARPLRDDGNLRVGNVRKSFDRRVLVTDKTRNYGQRCEEEYKKPVLQRERDYIFDELIHGSGLNRDLPDFCDSSDFLIDVTTQIGQIPVIISLIIRIS
jgi:hypothetical protein